MSILCLRRSNQLIMRKLNIPATIVSIFIYWLKGADKRSQIFEEILLLEIFLIPCVYYVSSLIKCNKIFLLDLAGMCFNINTQIIVL